MQLEKTLNQLGYDSNDVQLIGEWFCIKVKLPEMQTDENISKHCHYIKCFNRKRSAFRTLNDYLAKRNGKAPFI